MYRSQTAYDQAKLLVEKMKADKMAEARARGVDEWPWLAGALEMWLRFAVEELLLAGRPLPMAFDEVQDSIVVCDVAEVRHANER